MSFAEATVIVWMDIHAARISPSPLLVLSWLRSSQCSTAPGGPQLDKAGVERAEDRIDRSRADRRLALSTLVDRSTVDKLVVTDPVPAAVEAVVRRHAVIARAPSV